MFGFGVGKIELKLPRTTFAAGEAIEGTLLLTVNKPAKARGLFAALYAEQQIREQVRNQGKLEMQTVKRRIYEFQQQLDTEKEYQKTDGAAAYPFSIMVPPDAGATRQVVDPLHGFTVRVGGLQIGAGAGPVGPAQWILEGYLDLPLALDVKASVSIGIRQ
jgi:hypothetical protein